MEIRWGLASFDKFISIKRFCIFHRSVGWFWVPTKRYQTTSSTGLCEQDSHCPRGATGEIQVSFHVHLQHIDIHVANSYLLKNKLLSSGPLFMACARFDRDFKIYQLNTYFTNLPLQSKEQLSFLPIN